MKKKKVWFFQPEVTHYRLPVFDLLNKKFNNKYAISVFGPLDNITRRSDSNYDFHRNCKYIKLSLLGESITYWKGALNRVKKEKPDVVIIVVIPGNLTAWLLPKLCKKLGIITIGWTKAHSTSRISKKLLFTLKKNLYKRYNHFISYGELSKKELIGHGIFEQKITVANNTIDTSRIINNRAFYIKQGSLLREKYNLKNKWVILYIARMDKEKRHKDILDAWPLIKLLGNNITLVIAGSGSLAGHISQRCEKIDKERIIFVGEVGNDQDNCWIAASDLNLQLGAVGLAINQSMAFGIPTLIADELGSDTEKLIHNQTGWRYPKGDINRLVGLIVTFLVLYYIANNNKNKIASFGKQYWLVLCFVSPVVMIMSDAAIMFSYILFCRINDLNRSLNA